MFGTSGRTRTGTLLRAGDFESPMSTNSITLAFNLYFKLEELSAGRQRFALVLWSLSDVLSFTTLEHPAHRLPILLHWHLICTAGN